MFSDCAKRMDLINSIASHFCENKRTGEKGQGEAVYSVCGRYCISIAGVHSTRTIRQRKRRGVGHLVRNRLAMNPLYQSNYAFGGSGGNRIAVRHCRAATLPRVIALWLTGPPVRFLRHRRRSPPAPSDAFASFCIGKRRPPVGCFREMAAGHFIPFQPPIR